MNASDNYFANARTISELEVLFASAISPANIYMNGNLSFEEARGCTREEMRFEFNVRMTELMVEKMDWNPDFLTSAPVAFSASTAGSTVRRS